MKNWKKNRLASKGGGNQKKLSNLSALTFNSENVVKIQMAGDEELENVEIEEIDENDGDLKLGLNLTTTGNETEENNKGKPLNLDSCDSSVDEDEDSLESIKERLQRGCECTNSCFVNIDPDEVYKHRLNIAELTKNEHDMYLMGITMGCIANCKTTHKQIDRQRQRATYVYRGRKVCLDAFLFLENITLYQIKCIRRHVLTHGVTPRVHGNAGKKAHNAFSLDVYVNLENYLKTFLKQYVTDFNKAQTIQGINRSDIYNSYKENGRKANDKLMGYSTFRHFMKKQFPMIKFRRHADSGNASVSTNAAAMADMDTTTEGASSSKGNMLLATTQNSNNNSTKGRKRKFIRKANNRIQKRTNIKKFNKKPLKVERDKSNPKVVEISSVINITTNKNDAHNSEDLDIIN